MDSNRPVTAMSIKMIANITSYTDGQLCGILDSIYFREPHVFSDVTDMIEIMETTFDALGFPDKALLPRSFGKAKERMRRHEADFEALRESLDNLLSARAKGSPGEASGYAPGGAIASFEIFVNFRLSAEWQGKVHFVDRDVTKNFRSIMELVKFIDESVTL